MNAEEARVRRLVFYAMPPKTWHAVNRSQAMARALRARREHNEFVRSQIKAWYEQQERFEAEAGGQPDNEPHVGSYL